MNDKAEKFTWNKPKLLYGAGRLPAIGGYGATLFVSRPLSASIMQIPAHKTIYVTPLIS